MHQNTRIWCLQSTSSYVKCLMLELREFDKSTHLRAQGYLINQLFKSPPYPRSCLGELYKHCHVHTSSISWDECCAAARIALHLIICNGLQYKRVNTSARAWWRIKWVAKQVSTNLCSSYIGLKQSLPFATSLQAYCQHYVNNKTWVYSEIIASMVATLLQHKLHMFNASAWDHL